MWASSVVMVRTAGSTHSNQMDHRMVVLGIQVGGSCACHMSLLGGMQCAGHADLGVLFFNQDFASKNALHRIKDDLSSMIKPKCTNFVHMCTERR